MAFTYSGTAHIPFEKVFTHIDEVLEQYTYTEGSL